MTRIALITGTSTGVGLSTAIVLSKAGFRVVATMRDLGRDQQLRERAKQEGVEIDVRPLDVVDQASVDACIQGVLADHGKIDVLVNNAGAGRLGTMEHMAIHVVQQVLDVNFLGVWRVTQAVLPSMRKARSGRIISVSSVGGLLGQPFNDAYCAAKFALEGAMESLAPLARQFGLNVSIIEPGPISTEFVTNALSARTKQRDNPDEGYEHLQKSYMESLSGRFASLGQTGDEVAQVILEAATSTSPHLRYPTSAFARQLSAMKLVDTTGDSLVAQTAAPFEKAS